MHTAIVSDERWPSPIADGRWLDPQGALWRLRGQRGEDAPIKRIERLLHAPDVTVWILSFGQAPVVVAGEERETLGDRLRAQSDGDAGPYPWLEAAEFKDDSGRRILLIEEAG